MQIETLGEARFPNPATHTVKDDARLAGNLVDFSDIDGEEDYRFELAGPRERIFFDPKHTRAGIVTCGGLCPGLNNVIRSLFLELHHTYSVSDVLGFRYGYQGLDPSQGFDPIPLTQDIVHDIHNKGGTILGTSRGPVDVGIAVENLIQRGINILFTIGGDGTQRGAYALFQEAKRRGYALSVIGIPKTIDNDVSFVTRTFGYSTAVDMAAKILGCAHMEARSVHNGISVVKLMGRHAGFIAAGATIASQDVNFVLIPEVPFKLGGENGFLAALKHRILSRNHAVIAVAEGAGQDLLQGSSTERDASGNTKLQDIGTYMRDAIATFFKTEGIPVTLRYIDPSYVIRSVAAGSEDAVLCDLYARNAVHAAMAGKTGMIVGLMHGMYIHVRIDLLGTQTKRVSPDGVTWHAALAACGQQERFT